MEFSKKNEGKSYGKTDKHEKRALLFKQTKIDVKIIFSPTSHLTLKIVFLHAILLFINSNLCLYVFILSDC
jgi:hypothetical protein